jgi:hypothetical protein
MTTRVEFIYKDKVLLGRYNPESTWSIGEEIFINDNQYTITKATKVSYLYSDGENDYKKIIYELS